MLPEVKRQVARAPLSKNTRDVGVVGAADCISCEKAIGTMCPISGHSISSGIMRRVGDRACSRRKKGT